MSHTSGSNGGGSSSAKASILQISRPYFTQSEISYLHSKTIPELKKLNYNQRKHQIFQFVMQIVKHFKFPLRVLATTMNYYQRYYLFNKFEDLNEEDILSTLMCKNVQQQPIIQELEKDCFIVAISCLFLATKNEDCIKKLRDIQLIANKLRDIDDDGKNNLLIILDNQRRAIMTIEFKLLQIIKFDFNNGCSYESLDQLVVQFCKNLNLDYKSSLYCWLISFDILSTPLYLMIPPHCIALAIIIITLNIKPTDIITKYNKPTNNPDSINDTNSENHVSDTTDTDINYNDILDQIDNDDFKCPELLVNEGILYILDYYVHQMNFSILNEYMPPIDAISGKEQIFRFMELKSNFNDLQCIDQKSTTKDLLKQDDYMNNWDYSIGVKGSARFMLGNKRKRFNLEVNNKKTKLN